MDNNNIYDSIVIGGGIAGTLSALNIDKKFKVLLIEKENELFPNSGSTHASSYRIHTGFHYIRDLETSKKCLYKSIVFLKNFPSFYINEYLDNHLHKSRFFLMSNSAISFDETISNCNNFKEYYRELVKQDETNKVFGEPDHFFKIIPKSELDNYISDKIEFSNKNGNLEYIHVLCCLEFIEYILDYNKFTTFIKNKINESSNIQVCYNTLINKIEKSNLNGYVLNDKFNSKSIINCSFESIENLDKQIFKLQDEDLWTRLKISVVIDIPNSMKEWFTNSIFSIGPFCSFGITTNNKMSFISEKYFNLGYFKSNQPIPNEINEIINKLNLNNEFGINLANLGLIDISQYFNEPFKSDLLKCKVYEIKRGFVKIHENNFNSKSIYNSNSGIHKRDEELYYRSNNYVSNCSTKMTYAVDDSFKSAKFINSFLNNK